MEGDSGTIVRIEKKYSAHRVEARCFDRRYERYNPSN